MRDEFLRKAEAGELVIGIVGLGYVGLPLAEASARREAERREIWHEAYRR